MIGLRNSTKSQWLEVRPGPLKGDERHVSFLPTSFPQTGSPQCRHIVLSEMPGCGLITGQAEGDHWQAVVYDILVILFSMIINDRFNKQSSTNRCLRLTSLAQVPTAVSRISPCVMTAVIHGWVHMRHSRHNIMPPLRILVTTAVSRISNCVMTAQLFMVECI